MGKYNGTIVTREDKYTKYLPTYITEMITGTNVRDTDMTRVVMTIRPKCKHKITVYNTNGSDNHCPG